MKKNEFIKQIRQKYKMSQKKFAEYLEVSKSLIEKVEMGKIPAIPENKYVKAVCALEGLDNEIFKFDEITDEILKEYELTKFSKAFRKFLYFYYGDFWNEDIEDTFYNILETTLEKITGNKIDNMINLNIPPKEYIKKFIFPKNYPINPKKIDLFYEIMIILSIKYFQVIEFNKLDIYLNYLDKFEIYYDEYFKEIQEYLYKIYNKIIPTYFTIIDTQILKYKLININENGKALTVENIKKLKKQKELEKIQNEVIPAPTDPKDKQICELLQYAPPAFKDKIIEKLLKFKDEVEDI